MSNIHMNSGRPLRFEPAPVRGRDAKADLGFSVRFGRRPKSVPPTPDQSIGPGRGAIAGRRRRRFRAHRRRLQHRRPGPGCAPAIRAGRPRQAHHSLPTRGRGPQPQAGVTPRFSAADRRCRRPAPGSGLLAWPSLRGVASTAPSTSVIERAASAPSTSATVASPLPSLPSTAVRVTTSPFRNPKSAPPSMHPPPSLLHHRVAMGRGHLVGGQGTSARGSFHLRPLQGGHGGDPLPDPRYEGRPWDGPISDLPQRLEQLVGEQSRRPPPGLGPS